jgi:hypothetical protein
MSVVLDHLAVGTPAPADGWELFGGVLGGTWAYGGDSPGFWWGQLEFAAGPKVELLTPTGGPDAAFLERFLAVHGAVHGIVIQVAWQGGTPPADTPPGELPAPGPAAMFDLIEHHVGDLPAATRLFTEVLEGRLETSGDGAAELTWPGGKRIRLVREEGLPLGGSLHHVRFTRASGAFGAQDRERAGLLAKRLGLAVALA